MRQKKWRVLIVEDEKTDQQIAYWIASQITDRVSIAQHGRAALRQIQQEAFDLILVDWKMPMMDGGEFLRELTLCLSRGGKKIPEIVIHSGNDVSQLECQSCTTLHVREIWKKPLHPNEFVKRMNKLKQEWSEK